MPTPKCRPPDSPSKLIACRRVAADAVHFEVGEDWLQGRTCYGGLIAALAVQAMRDIAGVGWPGAVALRALQTSFVAPVAPGALEIGVQLLRAGRNVSQLLAQARQGGQVAAALLGTFGAERPSALPPRRPSQPPARAQPEQLPAPPPRPPGAPPFLGHFDMRWAEGPPPFTGGSGYTTCVHLRLKPGDAAELSPELQAVLLADLAPTPVIGHLRRPAPNSSASWALELHPLGATAADGWWRADSESLAVDGGYVDHAAKLWAPDGQLAASSTQVVAVFA